MQLNPYGQDSMLLAVSLVNRPPADAAELTRRCVDAGLVLERTASEADVSSLRRFLRNWEAVVDQPDPAARAALLNPMLARYAEAPHLTDHAQTGWHLHFRNDHLPVDRQVAALITVGTALHLAGRGMDRLGRCAAQDCRQVYADISRTGRQRYCSPACGNRDAVRRHRARSQPDKAKA